MADCLGGHRQFGLFLHFPLFLALVLTCTRPHVVGQTTAVEDQNATESTRSTPSGYEASSSLSEGTPELTTIGSLSSQLFSFESSVLFDGASLLLTSATFPVLTPTSPLISLTLLAAPSHTLLSLASASTTSQLVTTLSLNTPSLPAISSSHSAQSSSPPLASPPLLSPSLASPSQASPSLSLPSQASPTLKSPTQPSPTQAQFTLVSSPTSTMSASTVGDSTMTFVPAVTPTVLPADPLDVQSLVVCIVFGIAFFVVGFIAIIIFFILLKHQRKGDYNLVDRRIVLESITLSSVEDLSKEVKHRGNIQEDAGIITATQEGDSFEDIQSTLDEGGIGFVAEYDADSDCKTFSQKL